MSNYDEDETQGLVFGVLAGIIMLVVGLVAGIGVWKTSHAKPVTTISAAAETAAAGDAAGATLNGAAATAGTSTDPSASNAGSNSGTNTSASGAASMSTANTPAETNIAAVGEALAKVYFGSGKSTISPKDQVVVEQTLAALKAKPGAIVLLSGFHDASGDPTLNAELAKQRAIAVRDALVAGGVTAEQVKMRKPESTVGSGKAAEGRRVEIRVQ